MTFRDDRDAQHTRIAQLEEALATAERERDRALAELAVEGASSTEPEARTETGERPERDAESTTTSFREGDQVYVDRYGTWWRATVREVSSPGALMVSYDDFSPRDRENVEISRVMSRAKRPPGPVGEPADPGGRFFMAFLVMVALAVLGILVLVALDHGLV